jgi:hypothetical protein
MPCLLELYYSAGILFRNWLCLTEFDWCGSLDTVVSMGMRWPTHLQEKDQVLLFTLRLVELRNCFSSVENVAEKAQSRLDEILTEAA